MDTIPKMLFGWDLFKKENRDENYFELGGSRSFHQFKYNNTTIVLIGEVHEKMNGELAKEYIGIFDQFVKNHQVKLFLESYNARDKIDKTSSTGLSFADCMHNLENSSHLEISYADKRHFDEGYFGLYSFLDSLAELEGGITELLKKQRVKIPVPMTFPHQSPEFMEAVFAISEQCNKNFSVADFFKIIETHLDTLKKLEEKYSTKNITLAAFIAECYLGLFNGYEKLEDLEKKCLSMGYDDEKIKNQPIIDICIDMMKREGTFYPAQEWLYIYDLYVTNFLNATLACDLWDEMDNGKNDEKTLIAVTGDTHTDELSSIFKELCTTIVSVSADENGEIISPALMNEFLKENFEHVPQKRTCTIS